MLEKMRIELAGAKFFKSATIGHAGRRFNRRR